MITRFATNTDDEALRRLDTDTMSSTNSPADFTAVSDARPFFHGNTAPGDVILAESDGSIVGYVKLEMQTPLVSNKHVLTVGGLAVDPARQNRGVGKLLMDAAAHEASLRGARKLSLRVLSTNLSAQQLYERCGFVVEGVLRNEFFLDGHYVDDILMARPIDHTTATAPGEHSAGTD